MKGPVWNNSNMRTFYNRRGHAVAYLDDDDISIYLYSGAPVAWLSEHSVYSYSGKHLGWLKMAGSWIEPEDVFSLQNMQPADPYALFELLGLFAEYVALALFAELGKCVPFAPYVACHGLS